jgi:hypothetical protein
VDSFVAEGAGSLVEGSGVMVGVGSIAVGATVSVEGSGVTAVVL